MSAKQEMYAFWHKNLAITSEVPIEEQNFLRCQPMSKVLVLNSKGEWEPNNMHFIYATERYRLMPNYNGEKCFQASFNYQVAVDGRSASDARFTFLSYVRELCWKLQNALDEECFNEILQANTINLTITEEDPC